MYIYILIYRNTASSCVQMGLSKKKNKSQWFTMILPRKIALRLSSSFSDTPICVAPWQRYAGACRRSRSCP